MFEVSGRSRFPVVLPRFCLRFVHHRVLGVHRILRNIACILLLPGLGLLGGKARAVSQTSPWFDSYPGLSPGFRWVDEFMDVFYLYSCVAGFVFFDVFPGVPAKPGLGVIVGAFFTASQRVDGIVNGVSLLTHLGSCSSFRCEPPRYLSGG